MKKFSFNAFVFGMLMFAASANKAIAQDVPRGINYQAVARNASGQLLSNQNLSVRISLLSPNASNPLVYQEIQANVQTNQFGLFNLVIGHGAQSGGDAENFAAVDWSLPDMMIKIEADLGSGYVDMGTSALWSVPYALYSANGTPGPQGEQGIQGEQGTPGTDGATGPQGPQGPIGLTGPQGPAGADGATGPQGPQGIAGADGAQGPIGLTGPQGEQGPAGADGLTGPQGPQGIAGADGAQGPIGLTGPQGLQGPAGAYGATGPQGPQGIAGADGAQGPIGLTGPQGDQGPAGLAGADGATGPQGPQGIAGVDGAQGPIGLTGPQGEQGPAGSDGATGPQGPQGIAGADGAQGLIGLTGPQGEVGPQGPAGADGATGPQGPQGIQGIQGLTGATGLTGHAGADGATGPQGPQGIAGPQGDVGPQGEVGPQGPQGISGGLAWTSDRPYVAGEVVVYQGETYICQLNNDGEPGGIFPTNETYFAPYSLVGPQGPQGEMGPQGPTGSSSANVLTGVVAVVNGGTGMDHLGEAYQQIRVNSTGSELEYFTPTLTGVQSINGSTEGNQTIVSGNAGNDLNISTDAGVHTINIPDAGIDSRGLITNGSQTIAGNKTIVNPLQINNNVFIATTDGSPGYHFATDGENLAISHTGVMDNQLYLQSNGDVQVRNNLVVSGAGQTGGGIILADDGDMVDMNNGYATMRFSAGVQVTNGNRSGDPVITLSSNGNVSGNAFIKTNGTGNQFLKADGSVDATAYATANDLTNLGSNFLPLSGGTLTGNLTGTDASLNGISLSRVGNTPFLNFPNGTTLSTVGDENNKDILFRNLGQLRFSDANEWDWNAWAGLSYKRATNQVVFGFPDGVNLSGNNSGTMLFSNVNEAYMGNTNNIVLHTGNVPNMALTTGALTSPSINFSQSGATPFINTTNGVSLSTVGDQTNKDLIIRNLGQLRFSDNNNWDWNAWAGLAYKSANNQVVLGFPDNDNFSGNATGTLLFSNVNDVYVRNSNNVVLHTGNIMNRNLTLGSVLETDLTLSQTGATPFLNLPSEVSMSTTDAGDLVLRNLDQLRFTDANDWDYSSWAGLSYKRANNQVVLGFPDGNNFLGANSGTLLFSNVNEAYMGNTNNVVIHSGNYQSKISSLSNLSLTQTGATPFLSLPSEVSMSTTDAGDLVFRNLDQLRFTDANDWDYSSWAGLAYKRATNQIVLGFPDGNNFLGSTTGTLFFSNVNNAYIGNTNQEIIHTGNLSQFALPKPADAGTQGQILSLSNNGTTAWVNTRTEVADEVLAGSGQVDFTLSQAPSSASKVKMYVNGIRISNAAYSISGTTLTYDANNNGAYVLSAGDRIQFDYSY